MKKVLELIRVSTLAQAGLDGDGLDGQRLVTNRILKQHDLTAVRRFELIDVSGTQLLETSEGQEILELIGEPEIAGIVVAESSRLLRPLLFSQFAILDRFAETNTLIYTADEVIDPNSFAAAIKFMFNREDLKSIKARMERGKEAKRRAGKHVGGKLSFGVALTPDRGFRYAADAQKVEIAAKAFLSGNTNYSALERQLDIPRTSLRCILQNPIYTGWLVRDERRDPSRAGYVPGINGRQGYRKKIPRAAGDLIRVKVIEPGLITIGEFEKIQRIIATKASQHQRYKFGARALYTIFRGFLRCGICGCPLYTGASQTMLYYYCKSRNSRERKKRAELGLEPCENTHMLRKRIEIQIGEFISVNLRDIDFLAAAAAGVKRDLQKKQASRIGPSTLRHKLDGLAAKRKRVIESYWDGDITRESKDEMIKAVDRGIVTFEQLLHEKEGAEIGGEFNLDILQQALEPLLKWEFLEYDDKRRLLTELSVKIVISKYRIIEVTMTLGTGRLVRFQF